MKGSEQRLGSTEAQLSTVGGQVAACEAGLSDLGSQIALLSGNDEAKQALHDIQVYLGVYVCRCAWVCMHVSSCVCACVCP